MRRKWLLLGIAAALAVVIVTVASLVREQSHLSKFRFLKGAQLVLDKITVDKFAKKKTSYREVSYNLRGDPETLFAAAGKELTALGWRDVFAGYSNRHLPFRAFANYPKGVATGSTNAFQIIELSAGRALVVAHGSRSPYPVSHDGDGWVAVQITQYEREPSWFQGVIATVFPAASNKDRDVVVVHSSRFAQAHSSRSKPAASQPKEP